MAWYFLFQYTMGRVIFTQPTPAPEIEKRIVIIICFLQTKERKKEKKKIKFPPQQLNISFSSWFFHILTLS